MAKTKAKLRLASSKDWEVLVQLVQEFHKFEGVNLSDEQRETSLKTLLENPELGGIWLIDCCDRVVGYVVLCIGYSIEFAGKDAFIDEFYIEPDFRGQGLGKQALELIKPLAKARGIRALHLEVERSHIKAQKLYTQANFEPREKYVLMSAKL
jgi:GNAT superfamily N-acetyltransferase